MGKRTVRLLRKDFAQHLDTLPGKEVHVVGQNGITWTGTVLVADSQHLVIRDANAAWYNRKRHQHTIPLDSVYEIIFDLVTEY